MTRRSDFRLLEGLGWLLLIYLIYSQAIPAFNYDLGVEMGTHDPLARVTEVGVAFWKGFAIGDVISCIPLLAAGLVGHFLKSHGGRIALAAALDITIYWPIVALAAVVSAQDATG